MSMKQRTSKGAPCIFCGDVGYDMRVIYGAEEDETVHWCHKTHASKGDVVSIGGYDYICISAGKQIEIGEFDLWKRYLTKEEWVEKQKRTNPDFGKGSYKGGNEYGRRVELSLSSSVSSGPVRDEEPVLPPEKLHEVYSYFLSLLVLEKKHEDMLRKEWRAVTAPDLADRIFAKYPIKSLPPVDKARFANQERFLNPTRKQIVAKLISRFGDLRGVPGFYMRSGSYYEDKPEAERWTFAPAEGIIFPCYDKDGYLYRLRYRDDYPGLKLKAGKDEPFNGQFGLFSHYYNKEGRHVWSFKPDNGESYIVYDENTKLVRLGTNGLPLVGGKANGKYKNFSSLAERMIDGEVVNTLKGGSRSGSPYSLYYYENQPFTVVIGTEGEKKSMVSSLIKGVPLACVPGVSSYECLFKKDDNGECCIDYLIKRGMKFFALCYDADKEENEAVRKAEAALVKRLKEYGVKVLIGDWSSKFNKGIDDILLMGLDITFHAT